MSLIWTLEEAGEGTERPKQRSREQSSSRPTRKEICSVQMLSRHRFLEYQCVKEHHQNMSWSHFTAKSNERNQILDVAYDTVFKQTKQTSDMLSFIVLCFYGLVSCKTRVQCWSDIGLISVSVSLSWCFVAIWPSRRSCSWDVVGQQWH